MWAEYKQTVLQSDNLERFGLFIAAHFFFATSDYKLIIFGEILQFQQQKATSHVTG